MTTSTANVVYLNPSTKIERELLHDALAPHSWAAGEFGLMLTEVAFGEAVKSLPKKTKSSIKLFLKSALAQVRKSNAGDVCLNCGLYT
jgi:hypothetical protein